MKKILSILAFLFVAVALMAQDKVINGYGLAGVTNSAAARKTAAFNYVFQVNADAPYYYALQVRQDDLGGVPANNSSTAYFQGSVDGTNYENIDTLSYGGSGTYEVLTKTSFKNFDVSVTPWYKPLAYKYVRVNITPSDTIWVKSIWLNVLPLR
jgi:hypothetical protein